MVNNQRNRGQRSVITLRFGNGAKFNVYCFQELHSQLFIENKLITKGIMI